MIYAGVGRRGRPAQRSIIARPAARIALARHETAMAADSRSSAMFVDGANDGMTVGSGYVCLFTAICEARLYFQRPRAGQPTRRIDERQLREGGSRWNRTRRIWVG